MDHMKGAEHRCETVRAPYFTSSQISYSAGQNTSTRSSTSHLPSTSLCLPIFLSGQLMKILQWSLSCHQRAAELQEKCLEQHKKFVPDISDIHWPDKSLRLRQQSRTLGYTPQNRLSIKVCGQSVPSTTVSSLYAHGTSTSKTDRVTYGRPGRTDGRTTYDARCFSDWWRFIVTVFFGVLWYKASLCPSFTAVLHLFCYDAIHRLQQLQCWYS